MHFFKEAVEQIKANDSLAAKCSWSPWYDNDIKTLIVYYL